MFFLLFSLLSFLPLFFFFSLKAGFDPYFLPTSTAPSSLPFPLLDLLLVLCLFACIEEVVIES